MSKNTTTTPILDGVCALLAFTSLATRKKRPTRKVTKTYRQVYDSKRGTVITLETTTATYTEQL